MEKEVFTSEAAKALGIGVSTLRNYAVILESKGYGFQRGANNGRIFREKDLANIREMTEKISKNGMTVEKAAEATAAQAASLREQVFPVEEKEITIGKLSEKIHYLEEQQAKLANINETLTVQVEKLTEKMKERERDQLLLERLEQSRNKKKRKGIAFFRTFMTFSEKKYLQK